MICNKDGCRAPLAPNNITGYCAAHKVRTVRKPLTERPQVRQAMVVDTIPGNSRAEGHTVPVSLPQEPWV